MTQTFCSRARQLWIHQPDESDDKFAEDARWVAKDLKILKELLEKGGKTGPLQQRSARSFLQSESQERESVWRRGLSFRPH